MVIKGLIGKKIGMTQIYKDGRAIPVTVIQAGPCYILEVKTPQTHGYSAIKIGYGEVKEKKVKKPVMGMFSRLKMKPLRYIKEIKIEKPEVLEKYSIGQELKVNIFKVGEYVDITGNSKGKGFMGGVKRWGWHIGPRSHGSKSHRAIGSVGASSDPSRVWKGLHMAGHEGNEKITVQNLEIVDIDVDKNLLVIKGCVPGAINSILIIRSAKKKDSELIIPEPEEKSQESEETKGKKEEIDEMEEIEKTEEQNPEQENQQNVKEDESGNTKS